MAKEKISGKNEGNKAQSLMDKILKETSLKYACKLEDSQIMEEDKPVITPYPMLNLMLSGKLFDGGILPGIVQFCGDSKTFKSNFLLLLVGEYLRKHPDAVFCYFDNEMGLRKLNFDMFNIPTNQTLHLPFEDLESLIESMTKIIDDLAKGEKIIIGCDSLGLTSTRREKKAIDEDRAQTDDLSKPKMMKKLFRVITPKILLKKIPAFFINHIYSSLDPYSSENKVISGGKGSVLASNTIGIITKQKLKDGDELIGYRFVITLAKSRLTKDNIKIPITVRWDGGVSRFSGLDVLASALGVIEKCKDGKKSAYQYTQLNGEVIKVTEKEIDMAESFWNIVFKETDLAYRIESLYSLNGSPKEVVEIESEDVVVSLEDLDD